MFGLLVKRKLDANRLANVFVNSILEATQKGFEDVSSLIKDDPAFVELPDLDDTCEDQFLLIVIAGNLRYLTDHFEVEEAQEIKRLIISKLADIYDMKERDFKDVLSRTDEFISRVNHPSKNTLYGMSKAIFHKFELNDCQESYFKNMRTPNPLFLKRMDEIMMNFLWDWEEFFKRHRLNLN